LLVLASELGPLGGQPTQQRMCELLGVTWESRNQVNFRRNWLLSLGLTERDDDGDHLTELGEQVLARHATEAAAIRELVSRLRANTLERAVAALSAGKHLLLVGPPGTAKTELAHFIAQAARREGYTAGAFVATAAADWTTFDTIGGYALQKTGELRFREGALL